MLNPAVWQGVQERQRALIELLTRHSTAELKDLRLLEIGCGSGGNLLELLRLGFDPRNLVANELLPERAAFGRRRLPDAVVLHEGNALELDLPANSFDIVYQSTVFTSILDNAFQANLARRMWEWVRPGGGVLWYDFTFDNPSNPDVRGVPLRRVRALFPEASIDTRRVTLAPPISRIVCRLHPILYSVFNVFPFWRTHVLCWIGKPLEDGG
ncbi:MAG TPA: class I SAM-dependent methyltransferase [Gammaproteobacteria bacterium]|nr:class I SAM-dependent methyltransferase [Gammaproteobacteria bacterium]